MLREDPDLLQGFAAACACEEPEAAAHGLNATLQLAIYKLQEHVGDRLVAHPTRKAAHCRPCNPWYDGACKTARKNMAAIHRVEGAVSAEGRLAYREFRRVTQAARRVWEAKRDEEVIRDIRVNSKKFWGAYKAQNKSEGNISLVDWTAYFGGAEGLFSGSGGDAVLAASR